jgi:GT2 family glycosyltransferase
MTLNDGHIDASSLSLVIPLRVDGEDRLENLDTSSRYIKRHLKGAELILVEFDRVSSIPNFIKERFDRYILIESEGPFSKSRCMNAGLLECTRPIVGFYDVDVLVNPAAIEWSLKIISTAQHSIVVPFNGVFVDITGGLRRAVITSLSVETLSHEKVNAINQRPNATARIVDGGIFLADRDVITSEGGYNHKMISYGWEDIEVLLRLEKLGYYRAYASANLIHLDHSRGPDSVRNEHFDRNRHEYLRVRRMSRSTLRNYVDNELRLIAGSEADAQRKRIREMRSRSFFHRAGIMALYSKVVSRLAQR